MLLHCAVYAGLLNIIARQGAKLACKPAHGRHLQHQRTPEEAVKAKATSAHHLAVSCAAVL